MLKSGLIDAHGRAIFFQTGYGGDPQRLTVRPGPFRRDTGHLTLPVGDGLESCSPGHPCRVRLEIADKTLSLILTAVVVLPLHNILNKNHAD